MTTQVQYTGHGANTGGLQGHSIGDEYPYTVIKVEDGEYKAWRAIDCRTGETVSEAVKYTTVTNSIRRLKNRLTHCSTCYILTTLLGEHYELHQKPTATSPTR